MRASLEHASDAELERLSAYLLRLRLRVMLILARRQSEARMARRTP